MNLSSQYWLTRNRIRARIAMLRPAGGMTERRRNILAEYLGYRDLYQDRDGHWCGKSGMILGNGPSGTWGRLPDDKTLITDARKLWQQRKSA